MAIPTKIKQLAHDVRNKIYGKDVRESIAKGMEESGDIADNAKVTSENAVDRVKVYKSQFDQSILNGDQPAEVQTLRVDPLTGETYKTASDRFEANQKNLNRTIESIAHVAPIHVFSNIADGINSMYQSLPVGAWMKIPAGEHNIDNTLIFNREVNVDASGAYLNYVGDRNKSAVQIGKDNDWTRRFDIKGLIVKRSNSSKYTHQNEIGIRIINVAYAKIDFSAWNFTQGVVIDSSNGLGNVYNQFTIGLMYNNFKSLVVRAQTGGWSNDNNFFGGGFSVTSDVSTPDHRHVVIENDGYRNNNLRFYGSSFEDAGFQSIAIDSGGASVYFYAPRFEGAYRVIMGPEALDHTIMHGFGTGQIKVEGKYKELTIIGDRFIQQKLDVRGVNYNLLTAGGKVINVDYFDSSVFSLFGNGDISARNIKLLNRVEFANQKGIGISSDLSTVNYGSGSLFLNNTGGMNGFKFKQYGPTDSNEGWKDVQLVHSGSQTSRPSNVSAGFSMLDTSLGKPIWWNGSNWIDAMGNRV